MNKTIQSVEEFLSLLSLVEDGGDKLYFRYEFGEEQTKRNRGYSRPIELWLQKIDGKFNMQGGYSPAYFNEDYGSMCCIMRNKWADHVAHNEIVVHVDRNDFSDIHQYEISRSIDLFQDGAAIYLSHRSGLIDEKFESSESIAAFAKDCKRIPNEVMEALTSKISTMLEFVIEHVKARDENRLKSPRM